ncbi:MAG: 50S ribosomal protein L3 [Candidatus Zambryskibacteria bacterium CG10_big_fil_rev_8_21_14_0_10_34_34]|uniref:Large ribosomal subunit protein uL3 n=1 Tax=Candidatus Zambryskibacteria bacterium CG10_big_fil_rev_8_21_14_0_10_34_34 TaxID=1975114 RepID=A0A2H0R199_9BACT|nr:MAG: 50S ribosomal protein L3 [Candidatus Zambryskibacteria bacterium CG10_big_fil_rev_8_21_14_0_10_34_34]
MKFTLAKKINMTQIFGEDGKARAVTVLKMEPTVVSQIKTKEKDGYSAVQIATGFRKEKNISKPVLGHLKDVPLPEERKDSFATLKEFRLEDVFSLNKGDSLMIETFDIGESVNVAAISKGKGFQGVVKRHGFHGGPRSHGQKHSEREPGSIGATGPQRVFKGLRMAGRMGNDRTVVKNLKIVDIDKENNIMLVSGAVPGRRGTLVEIRSTNLK